MLGTLSLMACTLLLAAVPSLSSSLQPREDVNLPAIGHVASSNGTYFGIRPLSVDSSPVVTSLTAAPDYVLRFAGYTFDGSTALQSYVSVTYTPSASDPFEIAGESADNPLLNKYFIVIDFDTTADSLTVDLPDLSYWMDYDGYYQINLIFSGENEDDTAIYGKCTSFVSTGNVTISPIALVELGEDVNPVGAIGDGLGVIGALGGALSSGFDGVFLDNGALTAVGTFSFVLLGLGISVGIVKKCFNWVTGRHGM